MLPVPVLAHLPVTLAIGPRAAARMKGPADVAIADGQPPLAMVATTTFATRSGAGACPILPGLRLAAKRCRTRPPAIGDDDRARHGREAEVACPPIIAVGDLLGVSGPRSPRTHDDRRVLGH